MVNTWPGISSKQGPALVTEADEQTEKYRLWPSIRHGRYKQHGGGRPRYEPRALESRDGEKQVEIWVKVRAAPKREENRLFRRFSATQRSAYAWSAESPPRHASEHVALSLHCLLLKFAGSENSATASNKPQAPIYSPLAKPPKSVDVANTPEDLFAAACSKAVVIDQLIFRGPQAIIGCSRPYLQRSQSSNMRSVVTGASNAVWSHIPKLSANKDNRFLRRRATVSSLRVVCGGRATQWRNERSAKYRRYGEWKMAFASSGIWVFPTTSRRRHRAGAARINAMPQSPQRPKYAINNAGTRAPSGRLSNRQTYRASLIFFKGGVKDKNIFSVPVSRRRAHLLKTGDQTDSRKHPKAKLRTGMHNSSHAHSCL